MHFNWYVSVDVDRNGDIIFYELTIDLEFMT